MAGAGYKLFNTGDVLTAAQVNTYLMEQTVMVFANAAARTTALSGVVSEGMISYLKDTNAVEVYDGSNWVSSDDPNAIQNTIVDAKGDLIAASAADTPARLAVGNNGETLVADSSATTGLRWQGDYAAGKNFLINGGFDIWQRGTSSGSAGYQTADRWYENATNSTTFAQETTTIPTDSRFAFKMTAGATAQMWIQQPIETLNAVRLAGRTIAVAADVSASTSTGMTINVYSSTTVDNTAAGSWGSAITATSGGTGTAVNGSFTRISGTYAIPSTAKSVMIQIITTSTVANGVVVYIGNVQAEIGSVSTAFTRAGGNIAGELQAAQRYYYLWTSGQDKGTTVGVYQSATSFYMGIPLPVEMRTKPTVIAASGTGFYYALVNGVYDLFNSVTAWQGDSKSMGLANTTEIAGTAGQAAMFGGASASSSIAFNAEL